MKFYDMIHIFCLLFISVVSILLSIYQIEGLRVALAIGISLLLIVLVFKTSGFLRISYCAFFIISISLNIYYQMDFEQILHAYNSYALFVALFVFTPLIKIPLEAEGYLENLIPKITNTSDNLLSRILIFSNFILGSFINIGGIRVIGDVFSDHMKKKPATFGRILTRSFSTASFWTPYFSAFSVAVAFSGGSPLAILFIGLFFSFIILIIWTVGFIIRQPKTKKHMELSKGDKHTIGTLIIYFALLVLMVVLLTHFTSLNVIAIISVISLMYSFLWCLLTGKFKQYNTSFKKFVSKDLLFVREEAFLFISVGFLANTFLNIGWKFHLPTFFGHSALYVFLFVVLFNVLVVSIALTGIHHLVTITLISTAINWQAIGVEPVVYGLIILLAWGLSITVSPFAPPNLITARITNQTPFQVGIKHNGLYGLGVLVGGSIYLTVVNSLVG